MQHRPSPHQPRHLLGRLRDVMAAPGTAQARLDRVVNIIAGDMVAEVCSVYVRRAGDVLELFATKGLRAEAVHRTRLRIGEGIVGDVAAHARPLALADAQRHPNFAYRPETGEEIFHSLMGVPILRGGRVLGVVVVQNRTRRQYTEEEIETLQTVAMVLAELVAGGEIVSRAEMLPVDGIALLPLRLEGVRLNPGQGIGVAVLHQPRFHIHNLVAENPAAEHERLQRAVGEMHGALDALLGASEFSGDGEHRDVLETYRMIAEDAGWLARIGEAIQTGLTAEAAVQKVHNDIRVRMEHVTDPFLNERLHDLDDLANRLLQHLVGEEPDGVARDLPRDVILVARAMGPAQLLDYDRTSLRGLVLEEGSATSHVAIVARALDIPVVGQIKNIVSRIEPGDPIIVDGDNGLVYIRPGEDVQQNFLDALQARTRQKAAYAALRDVPAVTRDGQRIGLFINAGLLVDVQYVKETGADGIGLYRTEIPFMVRSEFPDVATQQRLYRNILDQVGDRPVVFRTLDVGGDKLLPYWVEGSEENPAMGWRAIRVSLDRPAMLRQQLRALIRAAAGRELRIMFPMISEVAEFDAARALFERERARVQGEPPARVLVGSMLEVPALAFQLPALLKRADFVAVGTNDLIQFLFASDRGNPSLAERYDVLSPVALSFLHRIARTCGEAGKAVSVCGEMAGRPLDAMALIAVGFRTLSVPPGAVGPVKAMIRTLSVKPIERYVASLFELSHHSVREQLRAFAFDHGVKI